MREKINKLAKGIIEDSTPLISVEPNAIEYELTPGEAVRFSVQLTSKNSNYIKGLAYSSDVRVKVVNPSFGGATINLAIDVLLRTSDNDNEIVGSIDLVTNGGEIELPYYFTKKHVSNEDVIANLETVDDFSAIVDSDYDTALKIYEYRNFLNAPFMNNLRSKIIYRALSKCPDRKLSFNQFLYGIGIRQSESASVTSLNQTLSYNDAVESKSIEDFSKDRNIYFKKHFYEYARLRLSYEMDRGNTQEMINLMSDHLCMISSFNQYKELITLLQAEIEYLKRNTSSAMSLIKSVSETIKNDRQEYLREYFLLEYLEIIVFKMFEKSPSFIRLCKKFIEEENMHDLFYYVLKLDDELLNDDNKLHLFLIDVYNAGSRSPYLYYYNTTLINDHPDYLYSPKSLDYQTLNFGNRYKLINNEINNAVVSASCSKLIKTDKRSVSYHKIYSNGIDLDLGINGLFEYYLYTLPNDDSYEIKDKVLEHYASGDSLDLNTKTKLYSNVVKYKSKNSNIYKAYEDRITDFAMIQLSNNNVSPLMAEIYKNVIKPEMVTSDNAEAIFVVTSSAYITTDERNFRNVVVVYPLTLKEYIFPISLGKAIASIFDPNAVIMFEDSKNNRYLDVKFTQEILVSQNTLRNAAIKAGSASNLISQIKLKELLNKKGINSEDVSFLEDGVYNPEVNDDAKAAIISRLIQYYNLHTASGYKPEFLLKINKNGLSAQERFDLINAYITCGCYTEAYDMIKDFGYSGIPIKNIKTLCSKIILENLFTEDILLLNLSELSVCQNCYDNIILDYLCEHYNGPTDKMYNILKKSIESQCNTYDMEERLLAQELFVGDTTHIDQVFEWYVSRKKASESIVKAYFVVKTVEYFFDNKPISSKIITYLENAVGDVENPRSIPTIFMLALTRYYSKQNELSNKELEISKKFIYYLCENNLVFPYFKKFKNNFELPLNIINSKIVVYQSSPGVRPIFKSQVLPTDEKPYVDLPINTFMNLYIYRKDLFDGEQWKYEIYEIDNDKEALVNNGTIDSEDEVSSGNMKYSAINSICKLMNSGNENEIVAKMEQYIIIRDSIKSLFAN